MADCVMCAKAHLVFDFAHRLASRPLVLDAVSSIIGPEHSISELDLHNQGTSNRKGELASDLTYGTGTDDIVSVWLALSAATIESGCMLMIPGSHTGPIAAHYETTANDNILSLADYCRADRRKPGSVRGSCAW